MTPTVLTDEASALPVPQVSLDSTFRPSAAELARVESSWARYRDDPDNLTDWDTIRTSLHSRYA